MQRDETSIIVHETGPCAFGSEGSLVGERQRKERLFILKKKNSKGKKHFSELGINPNYNITSKDKTQGRLLKLRDMRLPHDTERGNAILFHFKEILSI